jgi:hypothetical protein
MKLPQRHKDILLKEKQEIQKSGMAKFKGGYNWINEDYQDVLIENLQVTDFDRMYPHIMVLLHDEGLIDIPEEVEKLKWFFNNVKNLKLGMNVNGTQNTWPTNFANDYQKWKVWVNSLYGEFSKQNKGCLILGLMAKYLYQLYDEILENNPHHIVYIDTDQIISINKPNLLDCPLPYSTDNLTIGIFKEIKRYVIHTGYDLKVKGYPVRKHEEIKREVKSKIRQHQLDKLLS